MKVLHCINTISAGGAENQLLLLCRELETLDVECVVAYLRREVPGSRSLIPDFEAAGIRTVALQGDGRYDVRALATLPRLLSRERPDVLHSHLPRADLAVGWCRMIGYRVPWVASIHGVYGPDYSGYRLMPLIRSAWRTADRVIAISESVRRTVTEETGRDPDEVSVVRYGIDPEPFVETSGDLRDELGIGDRPAIGCLGRLDPRKAQDVLIRALPAVLDQVPAAVLVLAGHDPWSLEPALRDLAMELGVEDRVVFPGFIARVPEFFNSIDVFALASRSEGFGLVVLEAMASRTPVVVSDIPALAALVIDGEAGLLAARDDPDSFAERIVRLLRDRELAAEMGRRGRRRVEAEFVPEGMARNVLECYCGVR